MIQTGGGVKDKKGSAIIQIGGDVKDMKGTSH